MIKYKNSNGSGGSKIDSGKNMCTSVNFIVIRVLKSNVAAHSLDLVWTPQLL